MDSTSPCVLRNTDCGSKAARVGGGGGGSSSGGEGVAVRAVVMTGRHERAGSRQRGQQWRPRGGEAAASARAAVSGGRLREGGSHKGGGESGSESGGGEGGSGVGGGSKRAKAARDALVLVSLRAEIEVRSHDPKNCECSWLHAPSQRHEHQFVREDCRVSGLRLLSNIYLSLPGGHLRLGRWCLVS